LNLVPRPTSFCNACSLQANDHRCRVLVSIFFLSHDSSCSLLWTDEHFMKALPHIKYSTFSEANLQILFTVAESAPSEIVRSNCTIALGDLAVRFPNLLEPWTEYIYARLRDPSVSVRKNAVLVISHLILNDMMKVSLSLSLSLLLSFPPFCYFSVTLKIFCRLKGI